MARKIICLFVGVYLIFCCSNADEDESNLTEEPFSLVFLGRSLDFYLNEEFSARRLALEFVERESKYDEEERVFANISQAINSVDFKNHMIAVRELIENTVASSLGPDRIEAAFLGKDPVAHLFISSVCNDFPKNHDLPYQRLLPRSSPLRIIDGFTFFNELDVLEVRLHELWPVVDKFVLVESAMTHSGKPKEALFDKHREAFEPFLERIVHVLLDTLPESPDHWVRERSQRDAIHEGVDQAGAEGEDLVMVSDVDEIPRRSTVRALSWCQGYRTPMQLRSNFHYYSLRHRWTETGPNWVRPFQWKQPRAALVSQLMFPRLTVNHLRYDPGDGNMEEVNYAGWHLSFFGGAESILTKIEAYAHQENNLDDFKDPKHIATSMLEGNDLFKRGAVHGELKNNTEPYDLPDLVLQAARLGAGRQLAWLPGDFDLAAYRSTSGPEAGPSATALAAAAASDAGRASAAQGAGGREEL